MHRKSGDGINPVDQAAISELEAANRAAAELIMKLSQQLADSQRLVDELKRDAKNPNQKNGSISGRASYMSAQLQSTISPTMEVPDEVIVPPVSRVETPHVEHGFQGFTEHEMTDTRDLMRLHILGFIDVLEKDFKKDLAEDRHLIDGLKAAIDVGTVPNALENMMHSLTSNLGHSKADAACSVQYKKFKDSVLKSCQSYMDNRSSAASDADPATQKSIDNVTFVLVKSEKIKEYLGKDKFSCLINIMRGCKSEDDIDEKLFMVSRMFPRIAKDLGDVVRNNLALYRVEGLDAPVQDHAEKKSVKPEKAVTVPTLFPPPRPGTPYPRRAQSDTPEKKRPDRAPPPTPTKTKN